MTPQQYCQQKAAASGSSFYYSFLFLPPEKREAITALYAFCREVDDIADECQEPQTALIKLNWWRDEVARLYAEQAQHPVSKALAPAIKRYGLVQEHFYEILDGMQMDLQQDRYPSFNQLQLYCYRVASVVGLLSAQIFGYQHRKTLKYAHDLGMAFQLTNIIRDVGEDARRGRIYLPLDELQQFGVSEIDILHGHQSPQIQALMEFQIQRAQQFYQKAFEQLPPEDKAQQRTGLMMAAIYQALLKEIQRDGAQKVLISRTSLTPLRKFWLAWLTYLKN
jgi:phytoene synthase